MLIILEFRKDPQFPRKVVVRSISSTLIMWKDTKDKIRYACNEDNSIATIYSCYLFLII